MRTIRLMEETDIEEIARLEKQCFALPWSSESLRSGLDREKSVFLVCCDDGVITGYVGMEYVLDEGYICNLAVAPESRRAGRAKELMIELRRYAQMKDLTFLTLEVRLSNIPAKSLYQKLGYEEKGIRKDFYKNPLM